MERENWELRRAKRHVESCRGLIWGGARPPVAQEVAFIDAHRDNPTGGRRWGIEPICAELQFALYTYWSAKSRPVSRRALRDAELGPVLVALFVANCSVYGRRKLHQAAIRAGVAVGRDQVARLMRANWIRGATRAIRGFTTKADRAAVRGPDLGSSLRVR